MESLCKQSCVLSDTSSNLPKRHIQMNSIVFHDGHILGMRVLGVRLSKRLSAMIAKQSRGGREGAMGGDVEKGEWAARRITMQLRKWRAQPKMKMDDLGHWLPCSSPPHTMAPAGLFYQK